VAAKYFLGSFTWYTHDFLYPLFKFINDNSVTFLFVCWLIGALVIFLWYWRKTLSYLDTIVDAAEILVGRDEEFVHLAPSSSSSR
jgi:two-component system sensor histidine kinase VanS